MLGGRGSIGNATGSATKTTETVFKSGGVAASVYVRSRDFQALSFVTDRGTAASAAYRLTIFGRRCASTTGPWPTLAFEASVAQLDDG